MLTLGTKEMPAGSGIWFATYTGKANITDVTDPNVPISLGGNLIFQVDMTDRGEPGNTDSIAITVWDGSTLLFSSNWGTPAGGALPKTNEQVLSGGNLVVH
jgi:hypothetical protein